MDRLGYIVNVIFFWNYRSNNVTRLFDMSVIYGLFRTRPFCVVLSYFMYAIFVSSNEADVSRSPDVSQ